MEDVLEIYKLRYDPLRPVVCLDETSRQLIEKRHIPVTEPGQIELVDYEYRRYGVVNLFMMFEPLAAKRMQILIFVFAIKIIAILIVNFSIDI